MPHHNQLQGGYIQGSMVDDFSIKHGEKQLCATFSTICWIIWKERCQAVYEKVDPDQEE